MTHEGLLTAYADVIIRTALNVQPGQPMLLNTDVTQRRFAAELARTAYAAGAAMVKVVYADGVLRRMGVEDPIREEYLDYLPSYTETMYRSYVDDGWCTLSLRGPENPDLMEGVDQERMGRSSRAASKARQGFLKAISANRIRWNVCLHPTPAWAEKVLGPTGDWERDIWDILIPILRLDEDDPAGAWLRHDAELKRRCTALNGLRYDRIRFLGPGTDLYIGMSPDRFFTGGRCRCEDGEMFFPNIPTEEIFSTPDWTRTEGVVACTRPVEVLGSQVEGAWFRFEGGRVREFGADRNAGLIEQYLAFDPGAGALGEVALVDISSPIYRSGKVFSNILLDENASCHIALGNGYADCIEGGTRMSQEELREAKCNESLVHTDFMIGSEEVSVFGVREGGVEEPVMIDGSFVI